MLHIIFSYNGLNECRKVISHTDILVLMAQLDDSFSLNKDENNIQILDLYHDKSLIKAFYEEIFIKNTKVCSWY